jgi:hypothetical protein
VFSHGSDGTTKRHRQGRARPAGFLFGDDKLFTYLDDIQKRANKFRAIAISMQPLPLFCSSVLFADDAYAVFFRNSLPCYRGRKSARVRSDAPLSSPVARDGQIRTVDPKRADRESVPPE